MLVTITSAVELSSAQTDQLKTALKKKYGQQQLKFELAVDPAVLGGLRLTVGGVRYDATIRAKLDSLRNQLAQQL